MVMVRCLVDFRGYQERFSGQLHRCDLVPVKLVEKNVGQTRRRDAVRARRIRILR